MRTASLDYDLDIENVSSQARTDIVAFGIVPIMKYSPFSASAFSDVTRCIQALTLVTVLTGPITDFDLLKSQQDELSSVTATTQSKKKQTISLREARQRTLKVLADAERELHEERVEEGRFFSSLWNDEDQGV